MTTTAPQSPPVFSANAAAILATEHWGVLGTRSMTWAEASSRTTVFLTVLSAAVVALALVADAAGFGDTFASFALALLPIVLFMGLTTYARLVQINHQDVYFVIAMNRLRHAYIAMAPELEPYFVTASTDDWKALNTTFSYGASRNFRPWMQFLVTTPTMVASINAVIAAAGAALMGSRMGASDGLVVVVGAVAFVVTWLSQFAVQTRIVSAFRRTYVPQFPGPGEARS